MKYSGIYKIINKTTNQFYIGSAINLKKRNSIHFSALQNNKHCNYKLQESWNEHGKQNFEFITIELVENKLELLNREQHYIDILKPEYNICPTAGSRLGTFHTPEIIEQIRKNATKFWLGKHLSEETKKKLSNVNRGYKHTPEAIAKIIASSQGENHPMYGKQHNEDSKRKMSEAKAKPIGQYTLDGTLIRTWSSGKEVQIETSMSQGNVNKVCLGKYKQAYGYIWKFI